jgi:hypothetical protein
MIVTTDLDQSPTKEPDGALGAETQRSAFETLRRSTGMKIKQLSNSFEGRRKANGRARDAYRARSQSNSSLPLVGMSYISPMRTSSRSHMTVPASPLHPIRDRYVTRARSHESQIPLPPRVPMQLQDEEEPDVSILGSQPQQQRSIEFNDYAEHEASEEFDAREMSVNDTQYKKRSKKKKKSVVRANEDNLTGETGTDDVVWSRSNIPPPPAGDRRVLRTRSHECLPLGRPPVQTQLQDEKKKKKKKQRPKQKVDATVLQTDEESLTGELVTDDESSIQDKLEMDLNSSKYFV